MLRKTVITIVAAIAVLAALVFARHVSQRNYLAKVGLLESHLEHVRLEGEAGWMTPRWAYRVECIANRRLKGERLSQLGMEGWEMVSARREVDRRAIDRWGAPYTEFIFKRPR